MYVFAVRNYPEFSGFKASYYQTDLQPKKTETIIPRRDFINEEDVRNIENIRKTRNMIVVKIFDSDGDLTEIHN